MGFLNLVGKAKVKAPSVCSNVRDKFEPTFDGIMIRLFFKWCGIARLNSCKVRYYYQNGFQFIIVIFY